MAGNVASRKGRLAALAGLLPAACAFASSGGREPAPRSERQNARRRKVRQPFRQGQGRPAGVWTTWCRYCLEEAPFVEKLSRELDKQAFAVVYPIYVVIDREGNVVATQRGAGGEDALRDNLALVGLGTRDRDAQ